MHSRSSPVDRVEWFADLPELARKKYWWEGLDESRAPSGFDLYLGLEDGASQVDSYDCQVMPGLLQTADYAREVIRRAADVPQEAVERRVDIRVGRQEILTRARNPLHFWSIIDEQVLHRPVGARDTVREQLQHLIELAKLPAVQLQGLPVPVGVHRANVGAFTVMRFPMPQDPGVVHVETRGRAVWFESQAEIDQYTPSMNHLRVMALPGRIAVAVGGAA